MAPSPGPLHDVAHFIGGLGSQFWHLSNRLRGVWLIGEYLAWPFYFCYEKCYWAAHRLEGADQRFETLDWDAFIWSPGAWVLVRLGADIGRADYFKHRPWAWVIWKFRKEHLIIDALITGDFRWIWNYLAGRFPTLWKIVNDPRGFIWQRIKDRWSWVDDLIFSPGMWLLVRLGADVARASFYRDRPWMWLIWKFRKEHPPIDAIITRDTGWLFRWVKDAIDDYLDAHIDWLIRTSARVINLIWEARI